MLEHLSDTLEVRSYLNHVGAQRALTDPVLESLEKFLDRLLHGPFRLRTEAEARGRLEATRVALASLTGADPQTLEISYQSLNELLAAGPDGQMLVYSVAESGSVLRALDETQPHRERREKLPKIRIKYQGETRDIGLERRLRTLMNAHGLKQVLRGSKYGVSFGKIFEKSIVTYYSALFAHAMAGDTPLVERMLPLAGKFRSSMPIGRYPKEPGGSERWLVFVE